MDFTCIVLFLALYYLKPQEWTSVFSTLHFVQMVMIAAVGTLIFRERKLSLKDFFCTPHDWAMYAFILWITLSSPTPVDTFKDISNRLVFYVVVLQTLTSWDRIRRYLGWWTAMIVIVAALALAGEYFWDPLGSYAITHERMKDRLVLNISMTNNPNSLGHGLAPVIAMLYYFFIWKRPFVMQEIGYLIFGIPAWAIYLTFSKGSYMVTAIAGLATVTFGRPKTAQIIIATVFIGVGTSAIYLLPRMGELSNTKTDPAVQGRIKAFTYGRKYYDATVFGIGQGQFVKRLFHDHGYYKAAHSTYVQTGSELGAPGMFLFLLILWCNLRTLMFAKTHNTDQERIRRLLFVLVLTYIVSGWMVDFAYRPAFFMFTAAISAFHRLLYKLGQQDESTNAQSNLLPAWRARLLAAPAPAGIPATVVMQMVPEPALPRPVPATQNPTPWMTRQKETEEQSGDTDGTPPEHFWNRIGFLDIVVVFIWLKATEVIWKYIIENV